MWKGRYIYKQAHTLTLTPPVRTQELDFLRHKGVFLLILFFLKTYVDIRITGFLPVQEE